MNRQETVNKQSVQSMICTHLPRLIGCVALMMAGAGASAETLMMPDRDTRTNVDVVVWGVSDLANGTMYSLDCGDTAGTQNFTGPMADRSYIPHICNYPTPGVKTATLTVGSEVATAEVEVFDPAALPGGPAGENNRSLGIKMAIEDGLRWLWVNQQDRAGNFPAGTTTKWGDFNQWQDTTSAQSALVVTAFHNHGYTLPTDPLAAPTGLYEKYAVQRGLNWVISSQTTQLIGNTPPGNDPCLGVPLDGDECIGLYDRRYDTFHQSYATAVAVLPLASSGALNRTVAAADVPANLSSNFVVGRTYGEILQRMINALAWGQLDSSIGRGGWYYNFNGSTRSDGSTIGWTVLAMLDAEAAGAVVPPWVRTEFAFALSSHLNDDGSIDYNSDNIPSSYNNTGPAKGGIGLQGLYYIGELVGPRVDLVEDYIDSWWGGSGGLGNNFWNCQSSYAPYPNDGNKGCAYSMFNNFKGLKLQGIDTLPAVTRPAGPGNQPAGDWYADYQDWFVAEQTLPNTIGGGNWAGMGFSCCLNSQAASVAVAELILSPVALVLPDAVKFAQFGLSPETDSDLELESHTVTAYAESTGGTPVAGATVEFEILTGPNAGLTGSDSTDSSGEATFTYTDQIEDGTPGTDEIQASIGNSNSNIVEMNWEPLNAPPTANDDDYDAIEDTTLNVSAPGVLGNDTDPDGDSLTAVLDTSTSNGTLTLNADGSFSYTPDENFCGEDSFSYHAFDGVLDSNVATVSIDVACVNDPPVAADDDYDATEDTPLNVGAPGVLGNDSDVEGDTLSAVLGTSTGNGSLTLNSNGSFDYTPNPNYCGPDSFTYHAFDGELASNVATVSIDVACVNDPPVAADDDYNATEDTPLNVGAPGVLGNDSDVDGDPLSAVLDSTTGNGSLTLNGNGSFDYTPNADYCGPDSFTYHAFDGELPSNVATVSIEVACVNDAPVIGVSPDSQEVQYSDPVAATFTGDDIDSTVLTLATSWSADGSAQGAGLPGGLTLSAGSCAAGAPPADCEWTVSGNITEGPGTYVVTAILTDNGEQTGTDTTPKSVEASVEVVVVQEDARSTYTGPLFLGSEESGAFTVTLMATIRDITVVGGDPATDPDAGVITNASVHFEDETGAILCSASEVTLVFAGNEQVGSASCDYSGTLGNNEDELPLEVTVVVGDHYIDTSDNEVVVLISRPGEGKITGGGQLELANSAGVYAADPNERTNYGFNAQATKKGKKTQLKGRVTIIVRGADGHKYKIKSNVMLTLGVDLGVDPDEEPYFAELHTKANLTDLTDPLNPVSIAGGLTLHLRMHDNGEPGEFDTISFTLWDGGTLLFSSNWDGAQTVEQEVARGNLQVHP